MLELVYTKAHGAVKLSPNHTASERSAQWGSLGRVEADRLGVSGASEDGGRVYASRAPRSHASVHCPRTRGLPASAGTRGASMAESGTFFCGCRSAHEADPGRSCSKAKRGQARWRRPQNLFGGSPSSLLGEDGDCL